MGTSKKRFTNFSPQYKGVFKLQLTGTVLVNSALKFMKSKLLIKIDDMQKSVVYKVFFWFTKVVFYYKKKDQIYFVLFLYIPPENLGYGKICTY